MGWMVKLRERKGEAEAFEGVIASEGKQSNLAARRKNGLLGRYASRNDD